MVGAVVDIQGPAVHMEVLLGECFLYTTTQSNIADAESLSAALAWGKELLYGS